MVSKFFQRMVYHLCFQCCLKWSILLELHTHGFCYYLPRIFFFLHHLLSYPRTLGVRCSFVSRSFRLVSWSDPGDKQVHSLRLARVVLFICGYRNYSGPRGEVDGGKRIRISKTWYHEIRNSAR